MLHNTRAIAIVALALVVVASGLVLAGFGGDSTLRWLPVGAVIAAALVGLSAAIVGLRQGAQRLPTAGPPAQGAEWSLVLLATMHVLCLFGAIPALWWLGILIAGP